MRRVYSYLNLNIDNQSFNDRQTNTNENATMDTNNKLNEIEDNNINNENDKIKITRAIIGTYKTNIKIKINQNIEKIKIKYKFKLILIEGINDNYIFIKIKNLAIENMLAISDWEYPQIDSIFLNLYNSFKYTLLILFFSIPMNLFHVKNEPYYYQILYFIENANYEKSEIKYVKNFKRLENFEKYINKTKFYFYLFSLLLLFFS